MKNFIYILMFLLGINILNAQKIEITSFDYNTNVDDFAPTLSHNGRILFFTSEREDNAQKVFFVNKTEHEFSSPDEISDDINDATQAGAVTLTPDGQYMIFSAFEHDVDGEGRTDLYSARKIKGEWTEVQNLGMSVNSEYWDAQPSISSDGRTLYFVSDRPGGKGGTDIWISKRNREGWGKAENLKALNSPSDEMSPVIAYDNKSLSFTSNKSGGLGGFDIYFTVLNQGNFSNPKNAGSPVNSAADEYFYYSIANTNLAYFSSDRSGGIGGLDIYKAIPNPFETEDVILVTGIVRDEDSNEPLGADIIITDLESGKEIANLRSDDYTGAYYAVLQRGKSYSITAQAEGYLFYSEQFKISQDEKGREEVHDIYLSSEKTRLLVFFDFDKYELQEESKPDLDRLTAYLNLNSDKRIRLEGHTDQRGDDEYNEKLSLNRAKAVKNHLVKEGIDKGRIETTGFGKTKPITQEKTEEAMAKNRRVEMRIID